MLPYFNKRVCVQYIKPIVHYYILHLFLCCYESSENRVACVLITVSKRYRDKTFFGLTNETILTRKPNCSEKFQLSTELLTLLSE